MQNYTRLFHRMGALLAGVVALGLVGCGGGEETVQVVADPETARMTTSGEVMGFADLTNTYAWKGIPYAAAPVGLLRWRAPQPAPKWEGQREMVEFGPPCIQFWSRISGVDGEAGEVAGSEDCLSLNIWAPRDRSNLNRGPLPVMLWIHGGGNTVGAARTYAGDILAGEQEVVVVTINYRLGLLGWFSHPALRNTAADQKDASGNYGTLDTIAALEWVRDNIAQFGGDPGNVTIFGESAGGRDVYALLSSPLAKGLFHKAISQSGSLGATPQSWAENYSDDEERGMGNSSREVAARLLQADGRAKDRASAKAVQKLMDDTELAAWLRDRSAAELLSATTAGLAGMYSAPQIVHDGVVVQSAKPRQQFDDPTSYNSVPFMTGTNRDESKLFMARSPELVSRFLGVFVSAKDQAVYNHIAALQSDHWKARAVDTAAARIAQADGAPVYAYRFDWDEGANGFFVDYSNLLGAAHALEINFVLGDYDRATMVPGLYDGTDIAARDKLSDAMMGYWAQFAYTGNPGKGRNGNLPEWGAWGSDGGNFMVLDTDADGGIRMSADGVTFEDIKNRLARDETLPLQARCEMYAQLFFLLEGGHQHWDPAQYDTMGCKGMDPYNALRGF